MSEEFIPANKYQAEGYALGQTITKAITSQLNEKDAEIERLKEENFRYSETQTKLDWEKETNGKLYAEIEELKADLETEKRHWIEDDRDLHQLCDLCKEAAEALERYRGKWVPLFNDESLVKRLREASK